MMKFYILLVITTATLILTYKINTIEPIENMGLYDFPIRIGDWNGKKVEMEEWVYKSLETKYAIMNNYYRENDGTSINFVIVWYDDKDIAFHAPEACLGGVGNRIRSKKTIKLNSNQKNLKLGELITEKNGQNLYVIYYYITKEMITNNQNELRLSILKQKLKNERASAALVRMITNYDGDHYEKPKKALLQFFNETLPLVRSYTLQN